MICQSDEIGYARKPGFLKSSHKYASINTKDYKQLHTIATYLAIDTSPKLIAKHIDMYIVIYFYVV